MVPNTFGSLGQVGFGTSWGHHFLVLVCLNVALWCGGAHTFTWFGLQLYTTQVYTVLVGTLLFNTMYILRVYTSASTTQLNKIFAHFNPVEVGTQFSLLP